MISHSDSEPQAGPNDSNHIGRLAAMGYLDKSDIIESKGYERFNVQKVLIDKLSEHPDLGRRLIST